ncbi:MAG: hypothetical protein PVI23_01720 [Maricaulaceae bacterium]|jgi:hypothetical protein
MPNVARPALAEGQAWTFKGAPAPNARAIIGAIEAAEEGDVVHLALVDLPSPRELADEREVIAITHMPFDRASVEESVEEFLGEEAPPESFVQGRSQWRDALDRGEAFVFSLTLGEALESVYAAADAPETLH